MSLVNFSAQNHPQQVAASGANDDVDDRGTRPELFDPLNERFNFTLDVAAAPHNAKCTRFLTTNEDGLMCSWSDPMLWIGPPCLMCGGSGLDAVSIDRPIPGTPFTEGARDHLTGLDCRACNGHGRQAVEAPARERVWCNPPYSDIRAWVQKAWDEWTTGQADAIVMLLPANRTEQAWWQDLVEPHRDKPDPIAPSFRVEFLRGRPRFDRPGWTKPAKGDRPPFGCCLLIWGEG